METAMIGLLAETAIHPGAGRGLGVVDLPVAREAATDYPVLMGSGLKGALRDKARSLGGIDTRVSFGRQDAAGDLLVSDGRLLLLPVRSLTSSYRWITSPHVIERYRRDLARAGLADDLSVPEVARGSVLAAGKGSLFLEERQFSNTGQPQPDIADDIGRMVLHDETRARLARQIAILNDDDFAWFVRYGLSVQARNVLEERTKKSNDLWYEETLPPDTVMYALIAGRSAEALDVLEALFPDGDSYLQVGGNETIGQGWFAVKARRTEMAGVK
ncbi:MAG: type III-B CRISPR module RAMP protein Cmr4 [bacterium]|nr:type III-B CRISPR module RAMP protein Cmr4 [bacterium]